MQRALALLVVAAASCVPIGSDGGTAPQSATSVPAYHATHAIRSLALLDPLSGPPEAEDAITQERYVPVGFQIRMKAAGRNTRHTVRFSTEQNEVVYSGVRVEADITFATATPSKVSPLPYVAVSCNSYKATATVGPRYMFGLDARGNSFIVRVTGTTSNEFAEVARSARPSDGIRETASNHVQADCFLEVPLDSQDNSVQIAAKNAVALVLTINGTPVLRAVDPDPGNAIPFAAAGFEINSGGQTDPAAVFSKFLVTQIVLGP